MHNASTAAGLGFNNAGLGLTHSLAHQLGAVWGVVHGRANALMLPHVVAFNAGDHVSAARYARAAAALGVGRDSVEASVEALVERVLELGDEVGMPRSTGDAGVPDDELQAKLDGIAQHALDDACTGDNVRQPTIGDLKGIYLRVSEGLTPRVGS
jgi:alcohol dehydrogenase class IV